MEFKERNEKITRLVLGGATTANVAKKYNLTNERIRQIVAKTCRMKNFEAYKTINHRTTINIPGLREKRDLFFT